MEFRVALLFNIMFKIVILAICLTCIGVRSVFSQEPVWFSLHASDESIEKALETAQNIDERNEDGLTGLIWAAKVNDPVLLKSLLKRGARVNARSRDQYRRTALHWAAYNGDADAAVENMKALLHAGADVHVQDYEGSTPFRLLARVGSLEAGDRDPKIDLAVLLIKHGADPAARDYRGHSMLYRAIFHQDRPFIQKYLQRLGSMLTESYVWDSAAFARSNRFSDIVEDIETEARRISRDPERLKPNRWDEFGLNTLMHAIIRDDEQGAQRLIDEGQAIEGASRDEFERAPLHFAVLRQQYPMIELLLEQGANTMARDANGNTPMHLIAGIQDAEKVRSITALLLRNKDDRMQRELLNAQNNDGNTPLHRAIQIGNRSFVQLLKDQYGKFVDATIENDQELDTQELDNVLQRGEQTVD